jgi:hypothetical protein
MVMAMNRCRVFIIVLAALTIPAGVIGYFVFAPGVHVTVRNTGQEVMRHVRVHVTGQAYALGNLAPGDLQTATVSPTSESHVDVEYTDEKGKRIRLIGGGYFEPTYRGQIDIEIRDGEVVAVKYQARICIY